MTNIKTLQEFTGLERAKIALVRLQELHDVDSPGYQIVSRIQMRLEELRVQAFLENTKDSQTLLENADV